MAKKKAKTTIDTPEDYVLRSWLDAERGLHKGAIEPADVPTPEEHPNEKATREAVESEVYTAQDVGLPS